MLAGETALERLQRAIENRVAQHGATFSNHYELAAFLYEQMKFRSAAAKARKPIMGRVDVLLGLLRLAQLDNAEALRPYLEDLDGDNQARPIADQIADRILAERSDLYQAFMDLQEKAGRNPYDRLPSSSDEKHELTGRFVSRWVVLERFQRNLAGECHWRAPFCIKALASHGAAPSVRGNRKGDASQDRDFACC